MTHAVKVLGNGSMQQGFARIGAYFTKEAAIAAARGLTQGRIQKMKAVPETVKRLMVELIGLEIGQGAEATERKSVTSFSNDGYSETFADPLTGEQVKELECNLVSEYLSGETDDAGTPLLYLGVD